MRPALAGAYRKDGALTHRVRASWLAERARRARALSTLAWCGVWPPRPQNIFINEQGQLKLIDNEACLQNSWRNCAFDSIFVPTTQKQVRAPDLAMRVAMRSCARRGRAANAPAMCPRPPPPPSTRARRVQEIVRLSNEFVLKYITADQARRDMADPQLLLDYRCWLGEGKDAIGTDYPPQIKQCLQRISAMTVQQVRRACRERRQARERLPFPACS